MTEQVLPRQDLTELVSDPSYETRNYWSTYRNMVNRSLGSISVRDSLDEKIELVNQLESVLEEGDPVALAGDKYTKSKDKLKLGKAAHLALGSMNSGEDKDFWLLDSALARLGKEDVVGDKDEVLKFVEARKLPGVLRGYLRGSSLEYGKRRDIIEYTSSEVQDAGIFRMERATNEEDLKTAITLFESAQLMREQRHGLGGPVDGRMEAEMLRRSLDTQALAIHARAMLDVENENTLHADYGNVQRESVRQFLESLDDKRTTTISRAFEWHTVLLDNYNVHKNRLYGVHYAYNAFEYQERSALEDSNFDIVVHDAAEGVGLSAFLQAKLIIPEIILAKRNHEEEPENHSFDHYLDPITIVTVDIPFNQKRFGEFEGGRLTDAQKIQIAHAARSKFKKTALRLQDYYEKEEKLPKALDKDIQNTVASGNWVQAGQ